MRRLPLVISVALVVILVACGVREDAAGAKPTPPTAATTISASPTAPGAHGWLLCLSTDRPIYHPGDTVNGRVVILDAVTFAPSAPRLPISLRMLDPHGKSGASSLAWSVDSIAPFSWTLPRDVAEGNYRVTADTAAAPATPAERGILVTTERTPALDLDLQLSREAWAPGETVTATLRVRQHDGSAVPGVQVRAVAQVDGKPIDLAAPILNATGEAMVQVPLPATFTSGIVSVIIDDGGRIEQLTRPLRRLSQPLIEWTPESGSLLAGVANVVYLQAQWRNDEPLALRGTLMDDQQQRIAEVVTTHEGRARVTFTPRADRTYHLTIHEPAGVSTTYPLPMAASTGVLLHAQDEQIAAGEPARLELVSAVARTCRIAVTRRGAPVAQAEITCTPRVVHALALPLPEEVSGVLEATVYDSNQVALAQRLLFRVPAKRLSLTMTNDRPRYGLDENATVTVQARDEAGRPVAAVVSVAVIDAGADSAVPPRQRSPRLPVMALLENEVEICADPTAYLTNPRALDLLLGTQHWRHLFDSNQERTSKPSRELAIRRLMMRRQPRWPAWPAMLPVEADAPVPALSSRHLGPAATPSAPTSAEPSSEPTVSGGVQVLSRWLKRIQRPDGSWSPTFPTEIIQADAQRTGVAPWSGSDADRATTALMVLCYLGAGYDHITPNKYKKSVSDGIAWLLAQAPDGRFSRDASVQGVVTCCLAEAYAMTNDQALKPVCERAIAAVLADQVQWQGQRLGWSATTGDAPICDADASLWCVFALKSALAGGLAIDNGMVGAKAYVQAAWEAANRQETTVLREQLATFPTRWDPRNGACHQPHAPAQGVVLAGFLGFHAGNPLLEGLSEHTFRRYYPPTLPLPLIESHLASLGLFLGGGERWAKWDESFRSLLIELQDTEDNSLLEGSWDPLLFDAFAAHGGRTITYAFAVLSLEIYYRFKSVDSSGASDAATAAPPPHEIDAGTRYWNAALRTDPTTGTATLTFPTPARPADLRVVVDAVDARGALGSGDGLLRCGADFTMEARLPQHLRVGDTVQVPLSVRDRRRTPATTAELSLDGATPMPMPLTQGVARRLIPLTANGAGILPIAWRVQAGGEWDALRRTIAVGQLGFPWDQHLSGMVTDRAESQPISFPQDIMTKSQLARLTVYPSPAAQLFGAVLGLLKEPHGCFEQISATSYPLIQAERLISSRPAPDERLRERMHTLLQKSYDQLRAYEVPDGGFSWWGKAPAHAALTAFGLMQFRELAEVMPVDAAMMERTRTWLLSQRDEHGVFVVEANQQAWGKACTNPYITWALLESAADPLVLAGELTQALDAVAQDARTSTNAYVVALAANALLRAGRREVARAALTRLAWNADGSIDGATASLLSNNPDDARQQATALALLAWLTLDPEADLPRAEVERNDNAVRYLLGRCADGTFGTTQTTVLTLRALRAFNRRLPTQAQEPVTVIVSIDGQDLPTPVMIPAISDEPIRVELTEHLAGRDHRVAVRQSGARHLPWALTLNGSTATPPAVRDPGFGFHVKLNQPRSSLGSNVMIDLSWKLTKDVPTPVAVIGIPGGLRPVRAALDDLVADGRLDAWEQTGDLLVLYWDVLYEYTDGLSFPCQAEVPGTFTGPPSRLYQYYDPDRRAWSAPLSLTIAAPPGW